jgi:hypothetical protein
MCESANLKRIPNSFHLLGNQGNPAVVHRLFTIFLAFTFSFVRVSVANVVNFAANDVDSIAAGLKAVAIFRT